MKIFLALENQDCLYFEKIILPFPPVNHKECRILQAIAINRHARQKFLALIDYLLNIACNFGWILHCNYVNSVIGLSEVPLMFILCLWNNSSRLLCLYTFRQS